MTTVASCCLASFRLWAIAAAVLFGGGLGMCTLAALKIKDCTIYYKQQQPSGVIIKTEKVSAWFNLLLITWSTNCTLMYTCSLFCYKTARGYICTCACMPRHRKISDLLVHAGLWHLNFIFYKRKYQKKKQKKQEAQGPWRSARPFARWHQHTSSLICIMTTSPKFSSVLLYDQPFSRYCTF